MFGTDEYVLEMSPVARAYTNVGSENDAGNGTFANPPDTPGDGVSIDAYPGAPGSIGSTLTSNRAGGAVTTSLICVGTSLQLTRIDVAKHIAVLNDRDALADTSIIVGERWEGQRRAPRFATSWWL